MNLLITNLKLLVKSGIPGNNTLVNTQEAIYILNIIDSVNKMKENPKNVFIKVNDDLPELKKVDETYNESKKVVVLVDGEHKLLAKLNTGIEDGELWNAWYCDEYEDTLVNVTHWCDCIPELPSGNKEG